MKLNEEPEGFLITKKLHALHILRGNISRIRPTHSIETLPAVSRGCIDVARRTIFDFGFLIGDFGLGLGAVVFLTIIRVYLCLFRGSLFFLFKKFIFAFFRVFRSLLFLLLLNPESGLTGHSVYGYNVQFCASWRCGYLTALTWSEPQGYRGVYIWRRCLSKTA